MGEIGGFIELWENTGPMLHEGAVALNSARGCLVYIVEARKIRKLALPFFLCDSVAKLCKYLGVEVRYYPIDMSFRPQNVILRDGEWLYVVNAYGQLDGGEIRALRDRFGRVIVDNVQAYFDVPVEGVDTLYSCRKFFGVADGAFLYTDAALGRELERDESWDRMEHLLGRYDRCASDFYTRYVEYEDSIQALPVKRMSRLTENFLRGIDYGQAKRKRTENFDYLAERLGHLNKLYLKRTAGAFAYPLLVDNGPELRKKLIAEKIYVPALWPNVAETCAQGTTEHELAANILPLPCDHRYGPAEMDRICDMILEMGVHSCLLKM